MIIEIPPRFPPAILIKGISSLSRKVNFLKVQSPVGPIMTPLFRVGPIIY
jgi:hypothetical protein